MFFGTTVSFQVPNFVAVYGAVRQDICTDFIHNHVMSISFTFFADGCSGVAY
jgi:hypothetical protein